MLWMAIMSDFSYLQTAKITEVFDSRTGLLLNAEEVVGKDDHAIELRTTLLENIEKNTPIYLCSSCLKPIYLRSNPEKTGQYFAHRDVDENCPKLEAKNISEDQIRAIKYNGAKESFAHIETKKLLFECLKADPRFSNEREESNWYSKIDNHKFRRPDVQAVYDTGTETIKIAFEIQLSATFLSEIVQRREFYRKEGALLVWVFRNFVKHDPRLTQLDIFYPNNLNAFVVNKYTRDTSIKHQKLFFECHFATPRINGCCIEKSFNEKLVSFDRLSLDKVYQQAYYYDYKTSLASLEKEIAQIKRDTVLSEIKKYAEMKNWTPFDVKVVQFNSELTKLGLKIIDPIDKFHRLIKSLISLELGRVVGFDFDNLTQCGNLLYDRSPEHIFFFLAASITFKRKELLESKGDRQKWTEKKRTVWHDLNKLGKNSKFWWGNEREHLILSFFPQIVRDFLKLKSQITGLI